MQIYAIWSWLQMHNELQLWSLCQQPLIFMFTSAEETEKLSEVLMSALEAVNNITSAYRSSDIY